jgi:hypothetical protein
MKRNSVPWSIVVLVSFSLSIAAKPEKRNPSEGELPARIADLQGVWEQVSRVSSEKRENLDSEAFRATRYFRIVSGTRVLTIIHMGLYFKHYSDELSVSDRTPNAIDFINLDDNAIHRCLYELNGDELSLCMNGGRKKLQRPRTIAPTPDGMIVENYKRLRFAAKIKKPAEMRDEKLCGLWTAIEIHLNGEKLDREKTSSNRTKLDFGRNHRMLYFAGDACVLFEAHDFQPRVIITNHRIIDTKIGAVDFQITDEAKPRAARFRWVGDTLELCWNRQGGERPTDFQAKAGDGCEYIRLQRVDIEDIAK